MDTLFTILVIAVLVALALLMYRRVQASRSPRQRLLQYVRRHRKKGDSDAKIKQQLTDAGWPAHVVMEAMKK